MPALQELRADARVEPHAARHLLTSAPSSSDTFAISLMNEILVARKAFEASLIISAEATSVRTTARRAAVEPSTRSANSAVLAAPTTTRSAS